MDVHLMTTDQLADAIRQRVTDHPVTAAIARPGAESFARLISERLPYIATDDVGALEEALGYPPPEGTEVCHRCDNPPCVNPRENDEAQAADEHAAAGTGRRDVLEDILEHWDTHVTDEVDDNPERNPHVGFVPAEKSGLVDALMEWRGGDLNDYVDPFAVHTVTVEYVAGASGPKTAVRHPVDCDRLPYGELCAFDKLCDAGQSLYLPEDCAPGEYEALIRRTDSMLGAGEEYIEIGQPVVRES